MIHHAPSFKIQYVLILADRPTNLDEGKVGLRVLCSPLDTTDDLLRHVRHRLNTPAAVAKIPLTVNHGPINASSGHIVDPGDLRIKKTFVGANVLICFITIVGHKNLPMFNGIHGTGINIDVGIDLQRRNFETAALENLSDRRSCRPLPHAAHDAANDENEFAHSAPTITLISASRP